MQNYDSLIMEKLCGDTPRQKYEYLEHVLDLMESIGWPRRGTEEEYWTLEDIVKRIHYIMPKPE